MPTARAMPSSPRRSAASITKIRKISRIPAAIENDPNVVKNAMNALPCLVGVLEGVLLQRLRPRGRARRRRGSKRCATSSESAAPGDRRPRVRDEHGVDLPGSAEELLRRRERDEQRTRRRSRHRRSSTTRARVREAGSPAAKTRTAIARLDAELVARPSLFRKTSPGLEVVERQPSPSGPTIGEKPSIRSGSAAKRTTLGSPCRCCRRLHRDRLDDRPGHAVDEPGAGERAVDLARRRLRRASRSRSRRRALPGCRRPRPSARSSRRSLRARRRPSSGSCGSSCRRS